MRDRIGGESGVVDPSPFRIRPRSGKQAEAST
ncbi:hypothetical protein Rrhod_2166 [Rhodococcus rhodnii LMG 5362]|uniref:Uncharacterized protein n=1 Tax=Rhodococcus rhodnii LMG 5362 TaxID=1273125 RepID=R7WM55_9NOCA|nr:hypothetical protein Rrhod_2166 [Rhodococcus rhodnii LMG 5362]